MFMTIITVIVVIVINIITIIMWESEIIDKLNGSG